MTKRKRDDRAGSVYPVEGGRFRAHTPNVPGRVRSSKVFGTRAEALAWLASKAAAGPAKRGTFGEYLDAYLDAREATHAAATLKNERFTARTYLAPMLGKVAMASLVKSHCEHLFTRLAKDGASADVKHRAGKLLRQVLNAAVTDSTLTTSPLKGVRVPAEPERDTHSLTPEELARLVVAADSFPLAWAGAAVRLSADLGPRPNELLPLTRGDYAGGKVTINKALCGVTHKVKGLKTRYSRRTLPVSDATGGAIERYLSASRGKSPDPLFPSARGLTWWLGNYYDHVFNPLCEAAKVSATPYTLRHTCATLLLRAGVNIKVVSERLGHKDVAMTLRAYAHCLPDDQPRAAEAIGGYLA